MNMMSKWYALLNKKMSHINIVRALNGLNTELEDDHKLFILCSKNDLLSYDEILAGYPEPAGVK